MQTLGTLTKTDEVYPFGQNAPLSVIKADAPAPQTQNNGLNVFDCGDWKCSEELYHEIRNNWVRVIFQCGREIVLYASSNRPAYMALS